MPLVIEMQVKLLFAYGVRNRLFGFDIVYFYVEMSSSIGRITKKANLCNPLVSMAHQQGLEPRTY